MSSHTEFGTYISVHIIYVPLIALLVGICLKGLIHSISGRFSVTKMLGTGGMPSTHSTFVMALATALGIKNGVWSDEFLIAFVFAAIIIYDAMNDRYQSGLHARALNQLKKSEENIFNESIGHTPAEVIVGGIIGFFTAVILLLLL